LSVAGAFVLGAIVSPPDAVAAEATFARFAIPRRIVAIVEGEGLLNDATALVIYGYAVAAAGATAFSLPAAIRSFVLVAIGGVLLGLVVAWLVETVARTLARFDLSDSLIENLLLIGTPYLAYVAGQAAHVSGVLAVVIAGIAVSRRSSVVFGPQTRLIGSNVWTLWIFVLNAYIFLAIGLQLRTFVQQGSHFFALLPAALAISGIVIVVRLLWMYPAAWLPRLIPAVRRSPRPPASAIAIIGWTGMRGIISLAAALALPASFQHRDVIVFVTFIVIFVTLVGQGLSLGPLLRLLHVRQEGNEEQREIELRIRALRAGMDRIAEIERETTDAHEREDLLRLRHEYENRIEHLEAEGDGDEPQTIASKRHDYAEIEALRAERNAILQLRDIGEIPDEAFRRIQYDLDLAESRLT
jgi:CPA1 family monovalent cation:H+ antiporter